MLPQSPRRLLIEFHERIVQTSLSRERVERSAAAIARLKGDERSEKAVVVESPAAAPLDPRPVHRRQPSRDEDLELETVWDGTRGRQGQPLTGGHGLIASQLGPNNGFRITARGW